MISRFFIAMTLCTGFAFGCSSSSSLASAGDASDVGTDGGDGHCCTPDPRPGCCMNYGGWSGSSGCGESCDGMPLPGDPAWQLVKDEHGCDVWSSGSPHGPVCGGVYDAGHDTGNDVASDAATDGPDADAPACPTLQPVRRDPCTSLGQICLYGCGVVMRCTADGWDYDTTIDGGPPCP